MTATVEPPVPTVERLTRPALSRAEGVELLGELRGSGYRDGVALVRRGDGQMVQLGPLMYGLLECVDGRRDMARLATTLSGRLGRTVGEEHVVKLAEKLAAQGLLAGTEHKAPPRRNPLLALRWKVLVTSPKLTKRLTAPFTVLFRPWLMWPILGCFAAVFWFVLIQKGVASATAQAFDKPGLLLLVFVLAVASAGFHELGHAAACRYGGATPAGMGMGLYLVWPAFYTDVTDAYRLPKRDRLRVDLGGLYFNAVVAVITMAAWLIWRMDALLLLVALQVLQMVKQLSPVIRADGYHILSDATGVPDLYAHMGPTLKRLLPGHGEDPSALTGRARLLVTAWVLIVVPVLLSLMLGAVLLFPKLATSAWDSGRQIALVIPHQTQRGQVLDMFASVLRLLALALPVFGSAMVTQRVVRSTARRARAWSRGRPGRRAAVLAVAAAVVAGLIWAWWPSGQYQPVRANEHGTLVSFGQLIAAPGSAARPAAQPAQLQLPPGKHVAIAMIPVGGASNRHPALFVIPGAKGKPAIAIYSTTAPNPVGSGGVQQSPTSTTAGGASSPTSPIPATAFPFKLPAPPGPGGTQALAVNTTNGGVKYVIAYSVVTVSNGAPVTDTNSAYALADCRGCTTVAVSFQIVLVVGQSNLIAPINAAGALNYNCPACTTTAIADQIVVTLKAQPSKALLAKLIAELGQLNELQALGAAGNPTVIASEVAAVQREVETELNNSGLLTNTTGAGSPTTSTSSGGTSGSGGSSTTGSGSTSSRSSSSSQTAASSTSSATTTGSSPAPTTTSPSTTTTTATSTGTSGSSTTTTTSTSPTG